MTAGNALIEELHGEPTEAWVDDLVNQLEALAANHDKAAKARELEAAREAFRRRQGMTVTVPPSRYRKRAA